MMNQRLLVVEGDADVREIYEILFGRRGFEMECATDGLDCVARFGRLTPAVLAIDQMILWGGADGVIAWCREEFPQIPFGIVLTTTEYVDQNRQKEAAAVGIVLVEKPFSITELVEAVEASGKIAARRNQARNMNASPDKTDDFVAGYCGVKESGDAGLPYRFSNSRRPC